MDVMALPLFIIPLVEVCTTESTEAMVTDPLWLEPPISIKIANSLHVMKSAWKQTRSASDIHNYMLLVFDKSGSLRQGRTI